MSADLRPVAPRAAVRIAVGAVAGLSWAASLRSYMAEINWAGTRVEWAGTFIGILLPGVLVGAALGAATLLDAGSRRGRAALRWCAAAPLAFGLLPMLLPDQLWLLLTRGLGGGAVGIALGGIAGGYALAGRRVWLRVVCGILALVLVAAVAATVPLIGGSRLGAASPRGVWVMVLVGSLLIVLMLASAIPFRRMGTARSLPRSESDEARQDAEATHSAKV